MLSLQWSVRHARTITSVRKGSDETSTLGAQIDAALTGMSRDSRPWIVCSSLMPSDSPLSYSRVRSAFTVDQRVEQTRESLLSIRRNRKTARIVLIDNTTEVERLESVFGDVEGVGFVSSSELRSQSLTAASPFKGLGEAFALLGVCSSVVIGDSGFWKLSGRYWLTDDGFAAATPDPAGVVATLKRGGLNTTCFSVAPTAVQALRRALNRAIPRLLVGVALEKCMYTGLANGNELALVERIGVEGLVASTAEHFAA